METKSTNSSEEKDLFLLYAIEMIIMSFKIIVITFILMTIYISFQVKLNILYIIFPSHNFLLSYIYFFIFIIIFSFILGFVFYLCTSKKEILKYYKK